MLDAILSFLPLASLYQMRSINRATCRTIEYMDEFVNKYSEALLLLNKAPSPSKKILKAKQFYKKSKQPKRTGEHERAAARESDNRRNVTESTDDKMDAIRAFPILLTPRGIALDMSRLAPTKPQSQTTCYGKKKPPLIKKNKQKN